MSEQRYVSRTNFIFFIFTNEWKGLFKGQGLKLYQSYSDLDNNSKYKVFRAATLGRLLFLQNVDKTESSGWFLPLSHTCDPQHLWPTKTN